MPAPESWQSTLDGSPLRVVGWLAAIHESATTCSIPSHPPFAARGRRLSAEVTAVGDGAETSAHQRHIPAN